MDRDEASDNNGFNEAYEAIQRVVVEGKSAAAHSIDGLDQWVRRRGRFGRLLLGAVLSVFVHRIVIVLETFVPSVLASLFLISGDQLLAAIVGVIFGQTLVQIRKFNQVRSEFGTMNQRSPVRADGGERPMVRDESDGSVGFLSRTSGGGFAGGAIVGAALGSSWGPGGAAGGAVFGAVLGDVIEESADRF